MLIEIHTFSFKKIHLKMSSGKWRPLCLGLNVLSDPDEDGLMYHTNRPGTPNVTITKQSTREPCTYIAEHMHNMRSSLQLMEHIKLMQFRYNYPHFNVLNTRLCFGLKLLTTMGLLHNNAPAES